MEQERKFQGYNQYWNKLYAQRIPEEDDPLWQDAQRIVGGIMKGKNSNEIMKDLERVWKKEEEEDLYEVV